MKRATNQHTIRPSAFRVRGAVLAAGLGATVVLGAGTAFASSGTAAAAPLAASTTADSVAQQAAAQAKAADAAKKTAAKKASDAKKKAEDKKKAAKKNAASWKAPVKKYKLTASYGTGGARWAAKHSGQDFAVPIGTPVSAVHTGTVVKAGPNGAGDGPAYGNAVVIKHSNGKYSQYALPVEGQRQDRPEGQDGPEDRPVRQHRQLQRPAPALRDPHHPELRLGAEPGRVPPLGARLHLIRPAQPRGPQPETRRAQRRTAPGGRAAQPKSVQWTRYTPVPGACARSP